MEPAEFHFFLITLIFAEQEKHEIPSEAAEAGDSQQCLCDGYSSQTGVYLPSTVCFSTASFPGMISFLKNETKSSLFSKITDVVDKVRLRNVKIFEIVSV